VKSRQKFWGFRRENTHWLLEALQCDGSGLSDAMKERDIFIAALQINDPAARDVFLTAACAEPGQKERLRAFLEAEQGLESFLEARAVTADSRPVEEPGRADPDRPRQDAPDVRARVDALLPIRHKSGEPLKHADPTPSATWDAPGPLEAAGTTIGPYKLLQQIGEGGMGTVYMAEQTEPVRRRVALKIIKPGMDSRQVIARFEAERQALAMMDHQNIARVLDAGTTGAKDEGGRKKDEQETKNRPNSSFILHPFRAGPTSSWSWSTACPLPSFATRTI
jgi:hypothetical protein